MRRLHHWWVHRVGRAKILLAEWLFKQLVSFFGKPFDREKAKRRQATTAAKWLRGGERSRIVVTKDLLERGRVLHDHPRGRK